MFNQVLILLAASVLAVAACHRLRLPPIIGYLLVGVALGPAAAGVLESAEDTVRLAEFGVVFLLFTVGLEFSFPQLIAMRWKVLGFGGAQVLLTSLACGLTAWWLGTAWQAAVVVGGALALSSTAIVIRQLTEQAEVHSRHGRNAVGVLLFQDLAVVPLLILIPLLARGDEAGLPAVLSMALAKGVAVFILIAVIGRWALRPLFREVARLRSNELFTLTVLMVILVAAAATHVADLSLALGAFLAGIMLGETEFRHQIEADIRPFRDVLLGLFFVTIGMLLDLRLLLAHWETVALIVLGSMAFKGLSVAVLVWRSTRDWPVALRSALPLAGGGEFGFAVLSLALGQGVVGATAGQLLLAAIVISMLATPVLIRHSGAIAHRLFPAAPAPQGASAEAGVARAAGDLSNHVLVCGYGRTGQNIARLLEREEVPYGALDLDPFRVREAQAAGEPVAYGDATRREIMAAAALSRARLVVITFDDARAALQVLEHTRELRPDVPVLVRTRDDSYLESFESAGATAVVPEVLEASLMLASHTLALLEVPMSRVFRYVREVRADRYRLLRGYFHGEERHDLSKAERFREQLHTLKLPGGAQAVGRRLGDLGLDRHGVAVTAVRRGGIRGPQPDQDTQLQAGDVLVLYGTPENLERARSELLAGGG